MPYKIIDMLTFVNSAVIDIAVVVNESLAKELDSVLKDYFV